MKIDAVAVSSSDLTKTVEFYRLLGFEFPELQGGVEHVEAVAIDDSARLMIDSKEIIQAIIEEEPAPGNHSMIAIQFDAPGEVDQVCEKVQQAGFKVFKQPWDAFWGQRYAVVEDPDGYKIDLYAAL